MIPDHAALPWGDVSALLCKALGHVDQWVAFTLSEFVLCARCGQIDTSPSAPRQHGALHLPGDGA